MHPLIHKWIRERPQMSIAERALCCQAAVNLLNQSIPLPPFGVEESEVAFRRQLLPHVDAVRRQQEKLQKSFDDNRKLRLLPKKLVPDMRFIDRARAQQYARFSRLYAESGRFEDALDLQVQVKEYVVNVLGMEDDRTVETMLAVSGTLACLTRINDAVEVLEQALTIALNTLGPDHPKTLKVMDTLGKVECVRGRFNEARKLHEVAIEGMRKVLAPDDPAIFQAMDNLGVVWHSYFDYLKAKNCQSRTVDGLTQTLGRDHPDTLIAKENLSMTYLEMTLDYSPEIGMEEALENGAESPQKAYDLGREVVNARREKLGREHNCTLWGITNLARTKSCLGQLEQAEADMRSSLAAGVRNLGDDHFGVLAGKTHLAQVLVAQKRLDEAEIMFQDVIDQSLYQKGLRSEGETPDHLLAVWYYAGCCQLNGKTAQAIQMLERISQGLVAIGATKHPFWQRVENKLEELRREVGLRSTLEIAEHCQ